MKKLVVTPLKLAAFILLAVSCSKSVDSSSSSSSSSSGGSGSGSGSGSSSGSSSSSSTASIIRLAYFSTDYNGDPAMAPNPHLVKESVSADGINFSNEKTIFSYNNLVDPDLFKIGNNQYGLLVTDFTKNKLVLATSSTVDGTFTAQSETGTTETMGQSSTFSYNGQLKTFVSGIKLFDFNSTTNALSNSKTVINVSNVSATSGTVADPSIIKLKSGKYVLFFKYAPNGSTGPSTHQVWMITSSDPTNFSGKATLIRDKASVPGAVRVGSKIYLYFVDASNEISKGGIAVGISSDDGATWSYKAVYVDSKALTGVDPTAFPYDETELN